MSEQATEPPLPVLEGNALRIKHKTLFRIGVMLIPVIGCCGWLEWSVLHGGMFPAMIRLLVIVTISPAVCVLLISTVILIRMALGLHKPTIIDSKITN